MSGGFIALGVTVLYVAIILDEGVASNDRSAVMFVSSALAASSSLAISGSLWPSPYGRIVLLSGAATAMFAWGLIGIFSVGMPLLLGSGFTWGATIRAWNEQREATAAAGAASVIALVVTVAGLAVTV